MFGKVHLSLVHLLERGGEDKRRKVTKTSLCLIVQSPKQLIMTLVQSHFLHMCCICLTPSVLVLLSPVNSKLS
jgi:hypothetical protein